jgi:hypothetical protein
MLAMTRYKLWVCSAHGGAAAVARMKRRKAIRGAVKAKDVRTSRRPREL